MKYITSLVLLLMISQSLWAGDKAGRVMITAAGHQITFTEPVTATVPVENTTTGAREVKSFDKIQERPYQLNGKQLISDFKVHPTLADAQVRFRKLLDEALNNAIHQLDTNASYTYAISDIVVDEHGRVAYYVTEGIKDRGVKDFFSYAQHIHAIEPGQQQLFYKALVKALSTIKSEPLIIDGKAVPYTFDISTSFIK